MHRQLSDDLSIEAALEIVYGRPTRSQEREAYRETIERATDEYGHTYCEYCGANRNAGGLYLHHIRFRSDQGKTITTNLAVLCLTCHGIAHGIRMHHLRVLSRTDLVLAGSRELFRVEIRRKIAA